MDSNLDLSAEAAAEGPITTRAIKPQEDPMTSYMPITKIVITALAAGITWLALQVGLDLGPAEINEAAAAIVGIVAGYLVPDARVK